MPLPPGVLYHGEVGVLRKGKTDQRYMLLHVDRLDFFASYEDASSSGDPRVRLSVDDIAELEVTDEGFLIRLATSPGEPVRRLELILKDPEELDRWIAALEPILDEPGDVESSPAGTIAPPGEVDRKRAAAEDPVAGADEADAAVEEDILHDGPLDVSMQGNLQRKHFFLLANRLEFTNNEEDDDVQGVFPLSTINDVTRTEEGFTLIAYDAAASANRKYLLQCTNEEAVQWISEILGAIAALPESESALKMQAPEQLDSPPLPSSARLSMEKEAQLQAKSGEDNRPSSPNPNTSQAKDSAQDRTSSPNPSTSQALFKGELGIFRKGRVDQRYFVLSSDSLEYWQSKEEFEQGDARRGCILLADMTKVEDTVNGFTVNVVSDSRSVELRCDSEAELDAWFEHWRNILPPTVCAIRMAFGKASPTIDESFPSASVVAQSRRLERMPTGAVQGGNLQDLVFVSWKGHDSAQTVKVVLGSAKDLVGPSQDLDLLCACGIRGRPKTWVQTQEVASTTGAAQWDKEFEIKEFMSGDYLEFEVRDANEVLGKAELHSSDVFEGVPGELDLEGSGTLSVQASLSNCDDIVAQGQLGIQKKAAAAAEPRYFVLFFDRLEYYTTEEDYRSSVPPRGMVALSDVSNFTANSNLSLILTLGDRSVPLLAYSGIDWDKWAKAWPKVFTFRAGSKAEIEAKRWSGELKDSNAPTQDSKATSDGPEQKPESKMDTSQGDKESSRPQPQASSPSAEKVPVPVQATKLPANPGLIHTGTLQIDRKGNFDSRHFALFADRLEYFLTATDMANGQEPRGQIVVADIRSFSFSNDGFQLNLEDRSLVVTAAEDELEAWHEAFEKVGVPRNSNDDSPAEDNSKRDSPQTDGAANPAMRLKTPSLMSAELNIDEDGTVVRSNLRRADTPAQILGTPMLSQSIQIQPKFEGSLIQGTLQVGFATDRQTRRLGDPDVDQVDMHIVLFPDRIECYADIRAARKGELTESFETSQVSDVEIVEGGLDVTIDGQVCMLRSLAGVQPDMKSWTSAFSKLFDDPEPAPPIGRGGSYQEDALLEASPGRAGNSPTLPIELRGGLDNGSTTPRQGSSPSPAQFGRGQGGTRRLLWQSVLDIAMEGDRGIGSRQYCALYDDSFAVFNSANDMTEGQDPASRVPLSRIRDLELLDNGNGFALLLDTTERLYCMVGSQPGILEAWVVNFQKVLGLPDKTMALRSPQASSAGRANLLKQPLTSPQQSGALLHQGILELEKAGSVDMRYIVLFEDRIEIYKERAHFKNPQPGERALKVIRLEGVQELKEMHLGFYILYRDASVRLHARQNRDFEEWKKAIGQVISLDLEGDATEVVHQGELSFLMGGKKQRQFFVLYSDRLEYTTGNPESNQGVQRFGQVRVADIRGFKIVDNGFSVRIMENQEMDLHVVNKADLDPWLNAFRTVLTGSASPQAKSTPKEQGSPRNRSRPVSPESDSPESAASLRPGQENIVIYQGALSIQHSGRLMKKFFVLYPDRLDYFENAVQAVSGEPPLGRFALSEVRGHDVFGCGLILNLLGRKVGLRADDDADVNQWDKVIKQAMSGIRPPGFQPTTSPRGARARSASPRGANGSLNLRGPRSPRSKSPMNLEDLSRGSASPIRASRGMSPSMATSEGRSPRRETSRSLSMASHRSGSPNVEKMATQDSILCRSVSFQDHHHVKRAATAHADVLGWASVPTVNKCVRTGGRAWGTSEVAGHILQKEKALNMSQDSVLWEPTPKVSKPQEDGTVKAHLDYKRWRCNSERDSCNKVNVPDEYNRHTIRNMMKEKCRRHGLQPSINSKTTYGNTKHGFKVSTDRIFLKSSIPSTKHVTSEQVMEKHSQHPSYTKITEAPAAGAPSPR